MCICCKKQKTKAQSLFDKFSHILIVFKIYTYLYIRIRYKDFDIKEFYLKNSIPFSQALRVIRPCSSQNNFNAHISNLKDWFLARDYRQKVVKEQIDKVVFRKQPTRKDTSEQGVPFVATYHSKLRQVDKKFAIALM